MRHRGRAIAPAPTSEEQFRAATDGGVPGLEAVREEVWSVGIPMPPGQPGLQYNLATILRDGDGRLHVIDPGWDTPDGRALLDSALERIGGSVASVTVTHAHPDHVGLAGHLRSTTGAPLRMHELEVDAAGVPAAIVAEQLGVWAVPSDRRPELLPVGDRPPARTAPDEVIRGDDVELAIPGRRVRALHTPAHTAGHLAFRLEDEGLLLTGDLLLPTVFPGVGLGSGFARNPIAAQHASLARIAAFADDEVLPGHGYRHRDPLARIEQTREHSDRRTDEVRAVLDAEPEASVWRVASALTWTHGWAALRGVFLYFALAQTAMRVDHARDACATTGGRT